MRIRYFDIDLNKDGIDDKIVVLIAPILFSASHGDTIEILITENGFYKIKILGDQTEVELTYDKNEKEYKMYLIDS